MPKIRDKIKHHEGSFSNIFKISPTKTTINHIFRLYATFSVAFLLSLGAYFLASAALPSFSIFSSSNVFATDAPSDCDPTTHTTLSGSICSDSNSNLSVSVSNNPLAYYISVSSSHGSAGTPVSLSYSQDGSSGGTLGNVVSSSDSVYLETNSPLNHQLLLSTTSTSSTTKANNLTGANTQESSGSLVQNTYIAPIGNTATSSLNSASVLGDNTWGFAMSSNTPGIETNNFDADYSTTTNSSKFTTVPTNNNQVLLLQDTEPTSTATIYYSVKADRNIPAGDYSNTVLYTALAEQPSEIRLSATNGSGGTTSNPVAINMSSPNQTLTIYTSINTTAENLGTATVDIYSGTSNVSGCFNPTVHTDSNNYLYVTCTTPNLVAGSYKVVLTLNTFGRVLESNTGDFTYTDDIDNAFSRSGITTMQDLTSEVCNAANDGDQYYLRDTRDNKAYRILKAKDNHCWMTDNLALDGTDGAGNVRTLTPSDSNVTQSRTLAANITNGTASAYDVVQIYSGNANSITSSCDTTEYPDCIVNTSTKYGNLYNWNAATAGVGLQSTTDTVTESICPKGWRLPDNTGDFSYANLMGKYSLPTSSTTSSASVQAIQQSPLYFSLSGVYNNTMGNNGIHGRYWTRVDYANITIRAYRFSFNANNSIFDPVNYGSDKNFGQSVRCVFGS